MNINNDFLKPQLTPSKLDLYIVRKSILSALKKTLLRFSGTLLDVGCGYQPYKTLLLEAPSKVKKYIGLDLAGNIYMKPDLEWDGKTIPLPDSSINCVLATEVFEHCPQPENVLKEISRVLKPGGVLFFTVPFLWNLHNIPNDEYRYTPFSLNRHLENSGFEQIELSALGGWDASLAQMLALWIRRRLRYSSLQLMLNFILSILFLPIIWFLYIIDERPESFKEGQMITGLCGTALKPNS